MLYSVRGLRWQWEDFDNNYVYSFEFCEPISVTFGVFVI